MSEQDLKAFLEEYIVNVEKNLFSIWDQCTFNELDQRIESAIAGLIARQANLAIEIAANPMMWTVTLAPPLLRTMVETHINLTWILEDAIARAPIYIQYGLGQQKLFLEHLKAADQIPDGSADSVQQIIEGLEAWLGSQSVDWAVEVNVGNWADKTLRQMAEEAGLINLYRYAYSPFSAAVHSMWNFVGIHNVERCRNPLHRFHHIPSLQSPQPNPDHFYRSAKYITYSFEAVIGHFGLEYDTPLPKQLVLDFANSNESDD